MVTSSSNNNEAKAVINSNTSITVFKTELKPNGQVTSRIVEPILVWSVCKYCCTKNMRDV